MNKFDMKNTKIALRRSINRHLNCTLCQESTSKESRTLFLSTALALRDRLVEIMLQKETKYKKTKRVYYLSMEYLTGRLLGSVLSNLNLYKKCSEIFKEKGVDIEEIIEQEKDAGLGSGGLGRLAACFLDSMATHHIPGFGYGIRYEYGLFKQEIDNGYQKEKSDNWLADYNPWEIKRADEKCMVPVYGRIEHGVDRKGNYNPMWLDWKIIMGIPYDTPIVGFNGETVNWLRVYSAAPSSEFDIQIFNEGDYFRAVEQKIATETVSKIIYPDNLSASGRELRLVQEYFLIACALRDILRRFMKEYNNIYFLPKKVAIHMNDTHLSLAVAELMRLLVDEYAIPWNEAWEITRNTLSYTNHTIFPEALEKWPVSLLENVIPRHLQIIYEINNCFLETLSSRWPGNTERPRQMSIIEEGEETNVRMTHLAIAGSHCINGVFPLHTELLKHDFFPGFCDLWPEAFLNITNGIAQRRWLLECNPDLATLITDVIGDKWIRDLYQLRKLEKYAFDKSFQEKFIAIKRTNKKRLARIAQSAHLTEIDSDSMFDIQAKSIDEYRRQLLKVMHIIYEYVRIIRGEKKPVIQKTFIFAGKATPGHQTARLVIKLINNVARIVNNDPISKKAMKVVFIPDYRISLAERLIPAADLSEQISMAGTEASGTGAMKFALNGALTVGTLDGVGMEILNEVGEDNIFTFGLKVNEIAAMNRDGSYRPLDYYQASPEIRFVMDTFRDDFFCAGEPGLFRMFYEKVLNNEDRYFHLADFIPYLKIQEEIEKTYLDKSDWSQRAILNIARMGKFSSDRAIFDYADKVWDVPFKGNREWM